jgi:hypothetical protein
MGNAAIVRSPQAAADVVVVGPGLNHQGGRAITAV